MADSTDWAKYVRDINTSSSTGWVTKSSTPPAIKAPWYQRHTRPSTHGLGRKAIPYIPGKGYGKDPNKKPGGSDDDAIIKPATTSIFTYAFFDGQPDYAIEAALSFKSLTGNEILQVAHRQNFYTNNAVLNNNILDIVDSKNFYLPTEIIKLQKGNFSYFQNNLTSYSALLTNSVVTVSIPISETEQSYKLQVETFAPNYVKNDTIYT
jgi:hypothetical protein